ncbi:hypothetical protein [Chishuiella sp.]|uniref:hypothetical protein n=1 Tax=Chishuiella sp. TaxID=1969467 RepID=UPI0028A8A728|nr:hypothetical protein [Chishuiella sp.]
MEKKEIIINKEKVKINNALIMKSLFISFLALLIITLLFGGFDTSYKNSQIVNPNTGYLVYYNYLFDKDYSGIENVSLPIFGSPGEYVIPTNIAEIAAGDLSFYDKVFNYYLPFIFIECLWIFILIFIITFILFKININYKIKIT